MGNIFKYKVKELMEEYTEILCDNGTSIITIKGILHELMDEAMDEVMQEINCDND
jgi:hypothetical protein